MTSRQLRRRRQSVSPGVRVLFVALALGAWAACIIACRPAWSPDGKHVAFITGEDIVNEVEDEVVTAAALGEVKLAKGWIATMLEPPCRMVAKHGGGKVNYYTPAPT